MARVLLIEDEEILAKNLGDALAYGGHDIEISSTGEEGLERVRTYIPDLILLDLRLPRMDGLDVLRRLQADRVPVPVIVMTAHGTIDTAVEAMKLGASDFLTKPLDLKALQLLTDRVLSRQRDADRLAYFRQRERAGSGVAALIGDSPLMAQIRARILKIAASPAMATAFPPAVLVTGETGTGKDVVARAMHFESPRADAPFVHVNCTAVPDELFEAELFGHVKGAFTSAHESRKGLMEVADGGTVFFDEIGHLKPALQAKLLTAIEQKTIRPVGATVERKVDVHVISATNRDLAEAIEAREFREDLYHRLRVIPIALPPLRDRGGDALQLARHFVQRYAERLNLPVRGIGSAAEALIRAYDWPGNVRELSHVIESAVLMCDNAHLAPEHLQIHVHKGGASIDVALSGGRTLVADFERGGHVLEDLEHAVIQTALEYAGHNVSRAARMLGITREAVRYRVEKHRARQSGDKA